MLAAVDLNDHAHFETTEIYDVRSNRNLATETLVCKLSAAQVIPEQLLRVGHIRTQDSGQLSFRAFPHDCPHPPFGHLPPQAGEGKKVQALHLTSSPILEKCAFRVALPVLCVTLPLLCVALPVLCVALPVLCLAPCAPQEPYFNR